jgi:hypothetical protein
MFRGHCSRSVAQFGTKRPSYVVDWTSRQGCPCAVPEKIAEPNLDLEGQWLDPHVCENEAKEAKGVRNEFDECEGVKSTIRFVGPRETISIDPCSDYKFSVAV